MLKHGLCVALQFYKYLQDAQQEKVLLESVTADLQALQLNPVDAEHVLAAAKPIIAFIANILKEQKACIDDHPDFKKARGVQ